jgi:hypothetical protein
MKKMSTMSIILTKWTNLEPAYLSLLNWARMIKINLLSKQKTTHQKGILTNKNQIRNLLYLEFSTHNKVILA